MFPDLAARVNVAERMDDPRCCETLLLRTVKQFSSINRLVSRYRTILKRWVVDDMAREPDRAYHLVDLGAGGCDIDTWLLGEARRRGLDLRITACDADSRIVDFARSTRGHEPGLEIQCLDALRQTLEGEVDYVFASHFLHHLSDDEVVHLLRRWGPITRRATVLSDLLRSRVSYLGYYLTSWVYRRSFARDDGLLSIRKGFRPAEVLELARRAGYAGSVSVHRLAPGRLVLHLPAQGV